MSGLLASAKPYRIKASHRRRRKCASGPSVQRYYDPGIGRFLSVDPVTASSVNGSNFNRYWYANNNPYRFTDPDGRAACPRTAPDTCLTSDTKKGEGGATARLPEGAAKVVVQNRSDFASKKPNAEKGGNVSKNADGSYSTKVQNGAVSTNRGSTATIPIELPPGSVAAVHSHSDKNMTLATANVGNGDSASLQLQAPIPMVTINRDRVMVRELIGGQIQARMLEGVMTPKEVERVQQNINREQGLIDD